MRRRWRRFGVTFGQGVRWAMKGSWRAWRLSLAAPSTHASPVRRPQTQTEINTVSPELHDR